MNKYEREQWRKSIDESIKETGYGAMRSEDLKYLNHFMEKKFTEKDAELTRIMEGKINVILEEDVLENLNNTRTPS